MIVYKQYLFVIFFSIMKFYYLKCLNEMRIRKFIYGNVLE